MPLVPIGRYKFILYSLLFYLFLSTYQAYLWFLDDKMVTPIWVACIGVITLAVLLYKRLLDIFNRKIMAKIDVITVLVIHGLFILGYFLLWHNSSIDNLGKNAVDLLTAASIFNLILALCLSVKKGKFSSSFQIKKFIARTLIICAILICHQKLLSNYYTSPIIIKDNMYPTIEMNDRLLISKTKKETKLKRGDIVYNKNFDNNEISRIIGLPGEKIELKGTKVYVNGNLLKDKYAFYSDHLMPMDFDKEIVVPKDHYLLMGDNRYYTRGGEIKIFQGKNQGYTWRSLPLYTHNIYHLAHKYSVNGKVIGMHYCRPGEKSKFVFKSDGSRFGFYPSKAYSKIYGSPN